MINNIFSKNKQWLVVFITICFLISLLLCMHYTLSPDETFTMGLIRFSFHKIINLDALDVHPPLYYFLLKTFLDITTFWTSSLIIKVLFARVFSILLSLIGLTYIYKMCKLSGIRCTYIIALISFFLVPFNIVAIGNNTDMGNLINIRMYGLAFMLISGELYEIFRFKISHNNINYICTIIYASLASYTHNTSAIIAGLIFIIFLISSLKDKVFCKKIFCAGVLFALLYIPWSFIAYRQIISVKKQFFEGGIFSGSNIIIIVLILILLYPYLWLVKHSNTQASYLLKNIFNVLIFTLIFMILMCIFINPMLKPNYIYPIMGVYMLISIISIFYMINIHKKMVISIICILFLIIVGGLGMQYRYQSLYLYHQIKRPLVYDSKNITIKSSKYNIPHYYDKKMMRNIIINNVIIYHEYNGGYINNINNPIIKNNLAATQSNLLRHYIYNHPHVAN